MSEPRVPAVFYLKKGVVVNAYVGDPPPENVRLRVAIIPPQSVSEQYFTMASGTVLCRLDRLRGAVAEYEEKPELSGNMETADAFVFMNEDAAAQLHDGRLSAAKLVYDILGTGRPPNR